MYETPVCEWGWRTAHYEEDGGAEDVLGYRVRVDEGPYTHFRSDVVHVKKEVYHSVDICGRSRVDAIRMNIESDASP